MTRLILSNSSISLYLKCHLRYYMDQVWRIPGESSVSMALGSATHAGVETFWKSGDLPGAHDRLDVVLDEQMPAEPDEPYETVQRDGHSMLDTYVKIAAPTFTPTLIEAPFVIDIDGVAVSGIIDAADDDLHDTKTTSGRTVAGRKPSFRPTDHRLQLNLYRYGYKFLTGAWPKRLLLDVIKRTGKYQQFEVEVNEREARDIIGLVADEIAREDFRPTGADNGGCRYCPFNQACRFSTERLTPDGTIAVITN